MANMEMDHSIDPKSEIVERLGNISGIELFNNQILCAVYVRPNKTKSGIYLSDKTVDEDRYQGKVGLLVAAGPEAFNDSNGEWFNGVKFSMLDWIVFRPSDGWSINVNGVLCRMMSDTQVKARISSPDQIW